LIWTAASNAFNRGRCWTVIATALRRTLNNNNRIPGYAVLGLRGIAAALKMRKLPLQTSRLDNLLDRGILPGSRSAFDGYLRGCTFR